MFVNGNHTPTVLEDIQRKLQEIDIAIDLFPVETASWPATVAEKPRGSAFSGSPIAAGDGRAYLEDRAAVGTAAQ